MVIAWSLLRIVGIESEHVCGQNFDSDFANLASHGLVQVLETSNQVAKLSSLLKLKIKF